MWNVAGKVKSELGSILLCGLSFKGRNCEGLLTPSLKQRIRKSERRDRMSRLGGGAGDEDVRERRGKQ